MTCKTCGKKFDIRLNPNAKRKHPSTWTVLGTQGDTTMFFAGRADIELYRSETGYYRDNLASGAPSLWGIMSGTGEMHIQTGKGQTLDHG